LGGAYIVPLEKNRTSFIYHETNYLPDSLLVQTYDTLGTKLWDTSGVLISHPSIEYQSFTTDGYGGFIVGGVINNFTVVAQQVSKYGNLGEVIPIPIELVSFTVSAEENKVILRWVSATEINNYGFEIERLQNSKIDGLSEWKKIGFVQGFGTTTEPKSYSFIDKVVTTGIYKYRLKQIDYDGSFEYSNIAEVAVGNPSGYLLEQNYPNPFNSSTIIKYQIPKDESVRINLYNILGEKILTLFEGEQESGEHQIRLSSDKLPSGNYFYSLEAASTRQIKKLTIIK